MCLTLKDAVSISLILKSSFLKGNQGFWVSCILLKKVLSLYSS